MLSCSILGYNLKKHRIGGTILEITLEKLQKEDAEKLFKFELENRLFFEEMVPSRGDDYYHFEIFEKRHQALLEEQDQGLSYFYLIKSNVGSILGRVNLIDIDKSQGIGHIGYRVGQVQSGKGIANKALQLLLEAAPKDGINQILAKTTTNNIASQKVLEKNGFKQITLNNEEFEMNGQVLNFVSFRWSK